MIKKIRELNPSALINTERFRNYVENFESELLRGISTLTVLTIINRYSDDTEEGIYGYKILKDLEEETNRILVIEEGTLYPLLKKLEKENILTSLKKRIDGRLRKYYVITNEGKKIYQYLMGFYSKLTEAIAPLMEIEISLEKEKYFYCPNCANKIDLSDEDIKFCVVCGYPIHERREK